MLRPLKNAPTFPYSTHRQALVSKLSAAASQHKAAASRGLEHRGMLRLLSLLSTAKAALRCLEIAQSTGLALTGPEINVKGGPAAFVEQLLLTPARPGCLPLLDQLWELSIRWHGAGSAVARKACDILLWAVQAPIPAARDSLRRSVAQMCSPARLAVCLRSLEGVPRIGAFKPSPFATVSAACRCLPVHDPDLH
jgi:hypothetical protein